MNRAPFQRILRPVQAVVLLSVLFPPHKADAVIFSSTADPSFNTSAPTGDLAGSGWQYQGTWGTYLGTPVSPNHFITAKHVGGSVGDTFVYNGISYTTTAVYNNGTDLNIWQVNKTFSTYAPLYNGANVAGQSAVIFGRGTQRGGEIIANDELKGWTWGASDGVMRWGENTVANDLGNLVKFTFDLNGGDNEVHISNGDSGGGVFIQEGGLWKLAAINYAVEGPFKLTVDGSTFNAAIFDRGGLYRGNTFYPDVATDSPSSFYATSISANYGWISSVTYVVPVPEPATWAMLVFGGGVLCLHLRKRRG